MKYDDKKLEEIFKAQVIFMETAAKMFDNIEKRLELLAKNVFHDYEPEE